MLRPSTDRQPEIERRVASGGAAPVTILEAVRQTALLRGVRKYAMQLMTPEGIVRSWNLGAERLTGYGEAEIIGKPYPLLLSAEAPAGTAERILNFARTHGHYRSEMMRRRRDGVEFMASCTVDSILTATGELGGFLEIVDDITERKEREDLLYQQATRDALTGVLNRGHFVELSEMEIARSQRFNEPLTLIMVDIDFFKDVNDKYGHLVGDEVLIAFAQRLTTSARRTDYVGRLGGEEFGVLLPRAGLEAAWRTAERLRSDIGLSSIDSSVGPLSITASLGIAQLTETMTDLNDLMRSADLALYRAKNEGRDCIRTDAS